MAKKKKEVFISRFLRKSSSVKYLQQMVTVKYLTSKRARPRNIPGFKRQCHIRQNSAPSIIIRHNIDFNTGDISD